MSHESPTKQTPHQADEPATLRDETPAGVPLTSRTADAQTLGPAVCAIRPHPLAATNPHLFAEPPDIIDQFGIRWTWSVMFRAYRADEPAGRLLCEPHDLCGNAFEWVLAESRAEGLARRVLLTLVWHWESDPDTDPTWPGYWWLWENVIEGAARVEDIEDAVLELVALGELSLDPRALAEDRDADLLWGVPAVRCWLPAYQAWSRLRFPVGVVTE